MNDQAKANTPDGADFVIQAPPQACVPVKGGGRFPVRRIYCIGSNYAAHAIEMGHDPDREPPFFFQKNPDNLIGPDEDFPYPPQTSDVHFEVEMVVALSKGGRGIRVEDATDHIYGYGVGLDMTRRDLQSVAKEMRRPWEIAKAFEASAPCSAIVPATEIGHPTEGEVWVKVNGELRQSGDLNQMIWKTPEMISYLSDFFELAPGDLIFSGTPSGVGAISRGDTMLAHVDGVGELTVRVV